MRYENEVGQLAPTKGCGLVVDKMITIGTTVGLKPPKDCPLSQRLIGVGVGGSCINVEGISFESHGRSQKVVACMRSYPESC